MLTTSTIKEAAQQANVAEGTLRRWIKREDFASAYRDARRTNFETALSKLQHLCNKAVDGLKKNLTCGRPAVETRCAEIILTHGREAGTYLDLCTRLTELEQRLKETP